MRNRWFGVESRISLALFVCIPGLFYYIFIRIKKLANTTQTAGDTRAKRSVVDRRYPRTSVAGQVEHGSSRNGRSLGIARTERQQAAAPLNHTNTMRFLLVASLLLAAASAFAPNNAVVNTRVATNTVEEPQTTAHRNRRSTIVQDGKANGRFSTWTIYGIRTREDIARALAPWLFLCICELLSA